MRHNSVDRNENIWSSPMKRSFQQTNIPHKRDTTHLFFQSQTVALLSSHRLFCPHETQTLRCTSIQCKTSSDTYLWLMGFRKGIPWIQKTDRIVRTYSDRWSRLVAVQQLQSPFQNTSPVWQLWCVSSHNIERHCSWGLQYWMRVPIWFRKTLFIKVPVPWSMRTT